MSSQVIPLSVVVLTYNEEENLPGCLRSVSGWTSEIHVVDSGSVDATRKIAGEFGTRIVEHPFESHTKQWGWALSNLPLSGTWVLGLDADQRVTAELKEELVQLFTNENQRCAEVDGFYVKRRQIFRGHWIRHGGYYPKYLLKLFRRGRVQIDPHELVDHHFYIFGKTALLKGDIVEENLKENDLSFWMEKHRRYAALRAKEEFFRRRNGGTWPIRPSLSGNPDERTLWFKILWQHLPLYVRSVLYFFYRYFLRLGFLDGKEGLIFHFLHGCWYPFYTDVKIHEQRRNFSRETSEQVMKP